MDFKHPIAIIYTTFLREELFKKTIVSLFKNCSPEDFIFIGDQTYSLEKKEWLQSLGYTNYQYIEQPFDCGISFARNNLISKIDKNIYKYSLLMADNINFNTNTSNLQPILSFLDSNKNNGLCGLKLNDRFMWVRDFTLTPEYLKLTAPKRPPIFYNNYKFIPCDVVPMFFVAKTQLLIDNPFDNEQKMGEHEIFMVSLKKNTKYKVFFTSNYSADYILSRPPDYLQYRNRLYSEYQQKAKLKLGVKSLFLDTAKGWEKCL